VFALADKGLRPVAVELHKYIEDGLIHLKDNSTYEIISKEQALAEAEELQYTICSWTIDHRYNLIKDHTAYIRKKLTDIKHDPFGYF